MKLFTLVLFFLCGSVSWADPFDPVTPWPFDDTKIESFVDQHIEGTWISCTTDDECWILTLTAWADSKYYWNLHSTKTPYLSTDGVLYNKGRYLLGYLPRVLAKAEVLLVYMIRNELKFQIGSELRPRQDLSFRLYP